MTLKPLKDKYPSYVVAAEKKRKEMLRDFYDDIPDVRAQLASKDPYLAALFDKAVKAVEDQESGEMWRTTHATGMELAFSFMRLIDAKAIDESGLPRVIEESKSYKSLVTKYGVIGPEHIPEKEPVKPTEPVLEVKSGYEGLYEARSFVVAQDMQQKALGSIQTTLMNQFAAGVTTRDAVKALNETFASLAAGQLISPGTPGYDFTKPAIQETTVRTLYNDAMNGGRNEVYEANSDFVKGTERSEVLDSRNHPLSKIVDGLKIKLSDPRRRRLTGSLHFNDRGVDIPITAVDAMKPGFEWSSDSEIDNAISKGKQLSPRFF